MQIKHDTSASNVAVGHSLLCHDVVQMHLHFCLLVFCCELWLRWYELLQSMNYIIALPFLCFIDCFHNSIPGPENRRGLRNFDNEVLADLDQNQIVSRIMLTKCHKQCLTHVFLD